MISVIPAIDLCEGSCVRLRQGDFNRRTAYSGTPLAVAQRFEAAGLKRLHLVDLDGARTGAVRNLAVLEQIAAQTGLQIDFGGGLRSQQDIQRALDAGALQVNVGSAAVESPELLREWLAVFGPLRIILSADVRGGRVAHQGWQAGSSVGLDDLLRSFLGSGLLHVACTAIEKDGELGGPAQDLYRGLQKEFPSLKFTASGGVTALSDIERLDELGLHGVIIGRALYEGAIKLPDLSRWISAHA